jgi:uncharacterized membrane protein YccC
MAGLLFVGFVVLIAGALFRRSTWRWAGFLLSAAVMTIHSGF